MAALMPLHSSVKAPVFDWPVLGSLRVEETPCMCSCMVLSECLLMVLSECFFMMLIWQTHLVAPKHAVPWHVINFREAWLLGVATWASSGALSGKSIEA